MALLKNLLVQGQSRLCSDVFANKIYANQFIVNNGTSSQFLKANGTLDSNTYATTSSLGTAASHAHGDYVTSIGTSSNTLTWAKGGTAQTAITVPYATSAGNADTVGNKHVADLENSVEITWSSLKSARDGSTLIPGKWYRITDYTCTTVQTDTQSAGHVFDIIVRADARNKLNENAFAAIHSGDTYFANSKLEAWELKYCLDNDTNRFAWADSTNGRGVIYWMKDEFDNECGYDFKNIQMKFYKITAVTTVPSDLNNTYSVSKVIGNTTYSISSGCTIGANYTEFRYTFDLVSSNVHQDYSLNIYGSYNSKLCHSNKIAILFGNSNYFQASNYTKLQYINFISFRNTSQNACYGNVFGNRCYNMSFGTASYNNIFSNYNYNNTFGDGCYNNTFSESCGNNIISIMCHNITLAKACTSIKINSNCYSINLGDSCYSNIFGGSCSFITFNSGSNSNTLGNYCTNILFGNGCQYIKFGDSSNTKNYYQYIIVENGNKYIYLNCTGTTSTSQYYQNVTIAQGTNTTYTYKTITDSNVGQTIQTIYQPADSQIISV